MVARAPLESSGCPVVAGGVGKRYPGGWVIRNLSFELAAGELLVLRGANGSGKTTLLRILTGLVSPSQGQVTLSGVALRQALSIPGMVGYLAQSPGFYGELSGFENLRFALRAQAVACSQAEIAAALAHFELPAAKLVRTYSGGMKKRLALAKISLQNPRLWLLDEPEASLDVAGQALLSELIEQVRGQATIILASHDLKFRGTQTLELTGA